MCYLWPGCVTRDRMFGGVAAFHHPVSYSDNCRMKQQIDMTNNCIVQFHCKVGSLSSTVKIDPLVLRLQGLNHYFKRKARCWDTIMNDFTSVPTFIPCCLSIRVVLSYVNSQVIPCDIFPYAERFNKRLSTQYPRKLWHVMCLMKLAAIFGDCLPLD